MKKSGLRILFITGSYPPDVCGVGDYAYCLLGSLRKLIDSLHYVDEIMLFYKNDWSYDCLWKYFCEIKRYKPDVIYMQYPTEGYKYSLLPQLLMLVMFYKRRVVNLHEFKRKSAKGKLAVCLFYLFGCEFVYTNKEDRSYAKKIFPWLLGSKCSVIRIGSNIPFQKGANDIYDVVYFGQIRPRKGIEDYISIIEILRSREFTKKIAFVGAVPMNYKAYALLIMDKLKHLRVEVFIDMNPEAVSQVLSSSRFCVLPFEDGISERRGSALAAMGNGCIVVGKKSVKNTPNTLPTNSVLYGVDNRDIANIVSCYSNEVTMYKRSVAQEHIRSLSWDTLAALHLNFLDRGSNK